MILNYISKMEINWSAIVLGIILLILIYIIYRLYIVDNSKVAYADLSKNQKSIKAAKLRDYAVNRGWTYKII